jgi:hypothetical protein
LYSYGIVENCFRLANGTNISATNSLNDVLIRRVLCFTIHKFQSISLSFLLDNYRVFNSGNPVSVKITSVSVGQYKSRFRPEPYFLERYLLLLHKLFISQVKRIIRLYTDNAETPSNLGKQQIKIVFGNLTV